MHSSSSDLVAFLSFVAANGHEEAKSTITGLFDRHGVSAGSDSAAFGKLVREIELDGSNTIATLFRGGDGVSYAEVARDVAEEVGVKSIPDARKDDAVWLEQQALFTALEKHYEGKGEAELDELRQKVAEANVKYAGAAIKGALTAAMWATLVRQIGARAVATIVRRLVLQTGGWFAARQAAATAARAAGMAIPVVNVALTAWLVADIASPALRKTLPTVFDVAMLRMEYGDEFSAQTRS